MIRSSITINKYNKYNVTKNIKKMFLSTTTSKSSSFHNQHIISASQFNREQVEHLMECAQEMKQAVKKGSGTSTSGHGGTDLLKGKVLYNMFLEPSTRTMSSFHIAMNRMGGQVCSITADTSSLQKGESLEDTIKIAGGYSDVIVMRNPQKGSAQIAASVSPVPVINAGDGNGEHPTQALLDAFTIKSELGKLDGLNVTMIGDLKNGRTVHSLSQLLANFNQIRLNYVSPTQLSMPSDLVQLLSTKKSYTSSESKSNSKSLQVQQNTYQAEDLSQVLSQTDVLYVTRLQKERFTNPTEYESLKNSYNLDLQMIQKLAKPGMIILHPLPRLWEIPTSIDALPGAAYFRQAENGLYMRMALLGAVLGKM